MTVTVGTGTATTTTVTSNGNPTTINGRPTFTATIAGGAGPTAGTVTFYDTTYGLVLGTGAVGAAHTATFRPASGYPFVGGNHNIVAQFGGNATFMDSTSAPLVQGVTKGAGAVVLAGKQGDISGNTYTFSAVYTPSPSSTGFEPNLGVMTFSDAVNGGASTAIATGVPNQVYASQGGYGLWTASGSAVLTTPGTHVITAQYNDVNFLSAVSNSMTVYVTNTGSAAGIYSPLPGSTLAATGNTNFKWFANGANAAAQYWLDIGPTQGSNNYYQSGNLSNVLSLSVANNKFPNNGSAVWARLWALVNGVWGFTDAQYTASGSSGTPAAITSPVPPGPLSGSSVTFNWNAGTNVTAYELNIGSTAGGSNYYNSGSTTNLMATANSLPTDGSTVYVTLYSLISGVWQNNQYTYTAFNATGASGMMQTPTPGSTLTGSSATFTWSAGAGASAYWLDAGSTPGGNQYYQSGNLGNVLTTTVNGLPEDGSTIYVTLYSLVGANWVGNAYTYTAFNLVGAGLGVMQTPPPSSTLSGNAVTFTWSAGANSTAYWVDVSNVAPGGNDLDQSGNLGNTLTYSIYNLPADGSTIYVTLYSLVGGQWESNAYTYVSGP